MIHVPSEQQFSESLELENNAKQMIPLLSDDSFSYVESDKLHEETIEKSLDGPEVVISNSLSREELEAGNSVVMSEQIIKNETLA